MGDSSLTSLGMCFYKSWVTINLASVFMLRVVALAAVLAVLLGLAADPFFMAELEGVVDRRYFFVFHNSRHICSTVKVLLSGLVGRCGHVGVAGTSSKEA